MILIVQGQNDERKLLVAGVRMQLFDVKCILYSILKLHWKCSLYFYLDRLAAKKARICDDIECYLCLSSTKEVEDDLEKFLRNVKKKIISYMRSKQLHKLPTSGWQTHVCWVVWHSHEMHRN